MHRNAAHEARLKLVELRSECTREIDTLKSRIIGLEKQIASIPAGDRDLAIIANGSVSRPADPLALSVMSHGDMVGVISDDFEPDTDSKASHRLEVEGEDDGAITWERSKDVEQYLQAAIEVMEPEDKEIVDRFVAQGDQFRRGMSPGQAAALEKKTEFLMPHTLTELERMINEGSPEERASVKSLLKDCDMMPYIGKMFELVATSLVDPVEDSIQDSSGPGTEPVAPDGGQR
jgi:hypothetical protein